MRALGTIIIALIEIVLGSVGLYAGNWMVVLGAAYDGLHVDNIVELSFIKGYSVILPFLILAVIPALSVLAGFGLLFKVNWAKKLRLGCMVVWMILFFVPLVLYIFKR